MTYKDLHVYKRAYKAALDLYQFIDQAGPGLSPDEAGHLKRMCQAVLGNIAESFAQRTAKAKRFFNFKAIDAIRKLILDLDFLHDLGRVPDDQHKNSYNEFDITSRQLFKLNRFLFENEKSPTVPQGTEVAVAA